MRTEQLKKLATSLVAFLLLTVPVAATPRGEVTPASTAASSDAAMPAMLRLALARSQATDVAAAYHLDREGRGANPRHGLELGFTARGARIDGPAGGFALRLERFGRGDGRPVRRAAPRIDGAWVEYDRGAGLSEWFVNLPGGVEQGWTVAMRSAGGGPLVLELDTARPPDDSDGQRLAWSGLVYHRIVALDADGRELPAVWTHEGTRLRIEVDDREAAYPVLIDPWVEQAKLIADDGAMGDLLGDSVALEDDTAVVGAPAASVGGSFAQGAAYVFTRSGDLWSQQAKLTADDGAVTDQFGDSVALAGDTALVGAIQADVDGSSNQGAAYIFTRSGETWSQQAKLTADDGAAGDRFAISVALTGDTALVGADRANVGGNVLQGAAYVFTRSGETWSQQAKLIADDGVAGDDYGVSVALAGDTALVGAWGDDVNQGSAYIYVRGGETWSQQAKLTANDRAANDLFGKSVALDGDTALVGAIGDTVDGNDSQGTAYVFTRNGDTWSQQAKLTANDGAASDNFGDSLALAGDTVLVGAPRVDVDGNSNQGAAYVFTRNSGVWSQQAKLIAADGIVDDLFGLSVALAGDSALAGAPSQSPLTTSQEGAGYVFFLLPLVSTALRVDTVPLDSDGNAVFEPGEQVEVAPSWRNDGDLPVTLSGAASNFTGPAGANYDLVLADADYGSLAPGAVASCQDTGECYALEVDDPVDRPALHWDARFDETLVDLDATPKPWTLHIGDSFTDVPRGSLFYSWIETLLHSGVTGGCGDTAYCPAGTSTRGQMPAFVLRALLGPGFTPEPCVGGQERFDDVAAGHLFCPWIEELAERGVVTGCGDNDYCPNNPVTRAQMAIFLLRTLEGADYTPPECEGVFADVDCPSVFADWVEELFRRGVTGGCGEAPLRYCPSAANTRGQMAVFLSRTFGLTLYGP